MAGPRSKRGSRSRGRGRRPARGALRAPEAAGAADAHSNEDRSRSRRRDVAELCELAPFSVFCALYLGLGADEGYAEPSRTAVAQRFRLSLDELDRYLAEHELTPHVLQQRDFDLGSAQLDIRVAPDGVSRLELARTMFEELRGR